MNEFVFLNISSSSILDEKMVFDAGGKSVDLFYFYKFFQKINDDIISISSFFLVLILQVGINPILLELQT